MTSTLQRVRAPRNRLIVIGDIHGCRAELTELLARLDPSPDDLVISTGDILRKGPDPAGCLQLWRDQGYLAVRGNNEEKVLELARARRRTALPVKEDRAVLRRRDLLAFVRRWPLVIDVPRLEISVVHGGLFPRMAITEASVARHADDVSRLRWIRAEGSRWVSVGKARELAGDVLWAKAWKGPRTIVYGHTPSRQPRIDRHAIGLDTGCVYGGWLTAAIYADGEWRFKRVRARKQYAD